MGRPVASRAARLFPAEDHLNIPDRLPKEQVKAMNIGGFWPAKLPDYLDRCIAKVPDKTAVADFNSTTAREARLNYRDFGKTLDRVAIGLAELTVEICRNGRKRRRTPWCRAARSRSSNCARSPSPCRPDIPQAADGGRSVTFV